MADTKISALPSATTPLAGTELIPIVQGGATTKVAASAFQAPLVSGTNIKTVNGSSLLGSGDLTVSASAAGSTTQVQFNDAGAFGGDAGFVFDKTTGKIAIGGKTVTASAPVLDLSQSWNAGSVTFTGIKFNVTDTASATGSLLMDLQVGGVSKFKVGKDGAVTVATLVTGSGSSLNSGGNISAAGAISFGNGFASMSGGSGSSATVLSQNNTVTGPIVLQASSSSSIAEQRNGANGQTFRVYGNYSTASDFRRLKMSMSLAGVAEIKPEDGGTYAGSTVLYISGLPTSNPGPGILWNNAGVVNVGT